MNKKILYNFLDKRPIIRINYSNIIHINKPFFKNIILILLNFNYSKLNINIFPI